MVFVTFVIFSSNFQIAMMFLRIRPVCIYISNFNEILSGVYIFLSSQIVQSGRGEKANPLAVVMSGYQAGLTPSTVSARRLVENAI